MSSRFRGVGSYGTIIEQERASGRVAGFVRVARNNLLTSKQERLVKIERETDGVRTVWVGDFGGWQYD